MLLRFSLQNVICLYFFLSLCAFLESQIDVNNKAGLTIFTLCCIKFH